MKQTTSEPLEQTGKSYQERLIEVVAELSNIQNGLQWIQNDTQEAVDALSGNQMDSELTDKSEDAIEEMECALEAIAGAIHHLQSAQTGKPSNILQITRRKARRHP